MKKNELPVVLVTGAGGQLGKTLKAMAIQHPAYHFIFAGREELSIDIPHAVHDYFAKRHIDFCINCAAYTAVDQAETAIDQAFAINATAVGILAEACDKHHTQLIHISTDYVFDGMARQPYSEDSPTHPINVYGTSKLKGEELAIQYNPSAIIIRSSWIYSAFGNNFVKTMLRLMKEKERINVISDQTGCPTYAADLAAAIMEFIIAIKAGRFPEPGTQTPYIYNYANSGTTNWYGFAMAIREFTGSKCQINPVSTTAYPTAAKRPHYSLLATTKIREAIPVHIPDWQESLQACLQLLH